MAVGSVKITIKSHVFGPGRDRCWCGVHHYICAECGADCTMGTSAGPATTDSRKVTRCDECNRLWERQRNTVSPWSKAEFAAIKVALAQIAEDVPDTVTAEIRTVTADDRRIATEILARAERAGS